MISNRTVLTASCLLLSSLFLFGCGSSSSPPDFAALYGRSARSHGPNRNPIIVIPGILGTTLETPDGRIVWGSFSGDYADPTTPDGARAVALPMEVGRGLESLRDEVVADHVLEHLEVSVLGIPIRIDAYRQLLFTLGAQGGYRDEALGQSGALDYGDDHYTCFQFPYDWRRDIPENARRLARFVEEKRRLVRKELEKRYPDEALGDVRFDIVAHSMGGLLARYFLRYGDAPLADTMPRPTWAGTRHVDKAILVGTPNAGATNALTDLVDGVEFSIITPTYDAAVIGTFPAAYQLLPRSRHRFVRLDRADGPVVDILDPMTWERFRWGLADPRRASVLRSLMPNVADDAARRRIALDHQRKCLLRARRLAEALDVEASPPSGLRLSLFAADSEPTPAVVIVDSATGRLRVATDAPGDGTVLRSSAVMDERLDGRWTPSVRTPIHWSRVDFLFADHLEMTRDPFFIDNILYELLEAPIRRR